MAWKKGHFCKRMKKSTTVRSYLDILFAEASASFECGLSAFYTTIPGAIPVYTVETFWSSVAYWQIFHATT